MSRLRHWFCRATLALAGATLIEVGVLYLSKHGETQLVLGSLGYLRQLGLPQWLHRPLAIVVLAASQHLPFGIVTLGLFGLLTRFWSTRQLDGETRCRKCGYILRGITEPRCSECGEKI